MKVQNFPQTQIARSLPKPRPQAQPVLAQVQNPPADSPVERVSVGKAALRGALAGAAYGAAVGAGASWLYRSAELASATAIHMGGILAGGALGAGVLGKVMQPKVEAPASYALGALAGAGVTWGTSGLGMVTTPAVASLAGAALGAFYGAVGGAIHAYDGPNGQRSARLSEAPQQPGVPKAAWSALSVAYGLGGTAITGAMIARAAAGSLTPAGALAGGLVAAGAFTNAYLTHKTAQMKDEQAETQA